MSRAAQIITEFTRGREFAFPHSAEEFLAMAYDEMAGRMHAAESARREAEKRLESVIHQRAVELADYRETTILQAPTDPTVWRLRVDPVISEVRMLSADPAKWHPEMLDAIGKQLSNMVTAGILRKLYGMREAATTKSV